MPVLLAMLSAAVFATTPTNPKALGQRSFDERLEAVHAVRQCYYDNLASAPATATPAKAKWLRARCAEAEASDIAVWTKWLPDLKADIPAAAEHNHQVIAEEVAADPHPEYSHPGS